MDMNLLFSIGLFDLFPQPVLFLQNTVIAGCNAAARGLGLSPGDAAPELPNLPACAQPRADQPEITSVFPGPQIEQTEAAVSACPSQMHSLETADPSSPVPRSSQPKTIPSSPVTQMVQVFLAGKPRDVTLLQAEAGTLLVAAAEPAQDAAQTLLSIANAMQSPLTTLLSASSTLLPAIEDLEDSRTQHAAAECTRAFYQLLRLRGHLRDFGGAACGELPLTLEKVELCDFFTKLYENTESLCQECGVTLHCKVPPRQFYAWIDRKQIARAVYELLSNALKHTSNGGEICLELLKQGEFARFVLLDSGEGLDEAALGAAFTRYTQFSPLDDARRGVGLGLPLVQRIVQLHGGRILLQTSGKGAAIMLSLPLVPADRSQLRSPKRVPEESRRRPELVALADVLPVDVFDSRNL